MHSDKKTDKKRKKLALVMSVAAALLILIGISIYLIWDVNDRLPNVTVVNRYTIDEPAEENEVTIRPISVNVYTVQQYNEKYEEDSSYANIAQIYSEEELQNWRIVVYTLKYTNNSDEKKQFNVMTFCTEAEKSGWHNGVVPVDGITKHTIIPGETQTVRLSSAIVAESIIEKRYMNSLLDDQYKLVYKYYPVKKELIFEVEQS